MKTMNWNRNAIAILLTSQVLAEQFAPFAHPAVGALDKRQSCPANYFSCASQGSAFTGTCCQNGQVCSLDSNNQAACCPSSAVCTGTAPASAATPVTASYLSNSLFNFPYIPTSFANGAACSSALSQCSSNYAVCTSDLASGTGGYAVTIVVPGGGGTTVAPTHTTVPIESATSICSSLSSQACFNLQSATCTQTGSNGGFVVGSTNHAPRQTAACMLGIVAGVGLGIIGAQV